MRHMIGVPPHLRKRRIFNGIVLLEFLVLVAGCARPENTVFEDVWHSELAGPDMPVPIEYQEKTQNTHANLQKICIQKPYFEKAKKCIRRIIDSRLISSVGRDHRLVLIDMGFTCGQYRKTISCVAVSGHGTDINFEWWREIIGRPPHDTDEYGEVIVWSLLGEYVNGKVTEFEVEVADGARITRQIAVGAKCRP